MATQSIGELSQALEAKRRERDDLVEAAAQTRGQLSVLAKAAMADCTERLDDSRASLDQLLAAPAALGLASWESPRWESGDGLGDDDLINAIRIGRRAEKLLEREAVLDVPYAVPGLDGDGALVFAHDGKTRDAARQVLQAFVLRVALCMPGKIRFTLLDPMGMGAAYPFTSFLGRAVRPSGRSLGDDLSDVMADIRRINERVIRDASRFSDLSTEQRAGEAFEFVVAADFPRGYTKDPRAVEALHRIAAAGPRAGRHLVLELNTDEELPRDFPRDVLDGPAHIVDLRKGRLVADAMPEGSEQKRFVEAAFTNDSGQGLGDWRTTVMPEAWMEGDSSARIETPIGERLRFWLGEESSGKPSAHAMVAGQTGSGKSSLLHVIITGLAARYAPDQLRFTLIDGKQGVEFEAYRRLPHADVVCLRTTPALARSVVADFVEEMEARYEAFQEADVVKLAEYRQKTGQAMPRRVLVVDEYQQILDGDPERGAELLGRLLEKGRAAGMHVVLGSQTFEQRGVSAATLTHIHTWASLSLQAAYVQGLQVFGAEGKRLIRELAVSGEVVVNDEGGRDGANSRGSVARLVDSDGKALLGTIVEDIAAQATAPGTAVVLSGRAGALPSDNAFVMDHIDAPPLPDALQQIARRPLRKGGFGLETWIAADVPVPLWLGRRFDVRGHALCALRRIPGGNLLVLGNQIDVRSRMLAFALAALPAMRDPASLHVVLLDGLREELPGGGLIRMAVEQLGARGVKTHIPASDEDAAEALAALAERTRGGGTEQSHLLVLTEPEYHYTLHAGSDFFSAPKEGPSADLRTILAKGPQAGVHSVVAASGLAGLGQLLNPSREASFFNHRVVQQMNEEESMTLFASLAAARISEQADHPFAAIHVDQILGPRAATYFHAYAADRSVTADQGRDAFARELARLAPK